MTMRMLNHVSYDFEYFNGHKAKHHLRAPGTFSDLELTPDLLRLQYHLTQGALHGLLWGWCWAVPNMCPPESKALEVSKAAEQREHTEHGTGMLITHSPVLAGI